MADEAPFQLLHQELIQYIYKSNERGEESGRNITKLENLGFRVGQGLIERLFYIFFTFDHHQVLLCSLDDLYPRLLCLGLLPRRLTKDAARFKDELDVMKFICKDFWTCVFKKQIDNLRTNHQVTEAKGGSSPSGHLRPPGQHVSLAESTVGRETVSGSGPEGEPSRACLQYLAFTCGLVRGALLSLGVKSIVTAEVSIMPASKTSCHRHHGSDS
ncbi:unnamed protein product [Tetraodon nigroviridis]|uniref:(spotted green pufferfish) hypothetical protein n=1 Tax=Tetraodon nigroviridis TaxID=99883 RepID=Q4T261_TETNG|nr:unnamed protein product [Tetraodon nigroviridis]